jgi:probable lipoprotein NlpC
MKAVIPRWIDQYVGVPYEQYDCWAIIRRIYQDRWQIALPDWALGPRGVPVNDILAGGPEWTEVDRAQARLSDIVAITRGRWVCHVGMVVDHGWMLHTEPNIESVLESYEGFVYRSRIAGMYRHPAMASAGTAGAV